MNKKFEPYKDIASIYDEVRPSYPDSLIQDIITATNLGYNDKILEIGAGTGKATVQFAEKGYKIHAVEIGQDMAKVLKDKCAKYNDNVSIDIASFEEWNPKNRNNYDMIYCAQAFDWIDASIKYKKCYDLLKNDGLLILFWYNAKENKTEQTITINKKVDETINEYVDNYYVYNKQPERVIHSRVCKQDDRKTEIEKSQLFEIIDIKEYTGKIRNTAEQYIKVRKSVPAFASILDGLSDDIIYKMDSEIENIIKTNGGYVEALFDYTLYITKKK